MRVMAVGSMGDSPSEGSVIVRSDRVETLVDRNWVAGDTGTAFVSEVMDSSGGS